MNRQLMEDMLTALWRIKADGPGWVETGICANVLELLAEGGYGGACCDEAGYKLSGYAKLWPESTGCAAFPVPAPAGFPRQGRAIRRLAHAAFYEIKTMWSGEYGSSRIRLLNFVIRKLAAELEGMPKRLKLPDPCYRSMASDAEMLIQLRDLKGRVAAGTATRGICWYVEPAFGLRFELFRMWPEFSGRESYPVRDPGYPESEAWAFHREGRQLWSGEYGSARIRLLNFCIRTLEARQ